MPNTVVNISFCGDHYKGGDGINRQHGQQHWEWLEQCVLLVEKLCSWPIFCSITGFRGFEQVEQAAGNCERDVLWRIFARPRVRLVTMAANPGHQVGAGWCIRLGLEAAAKTGYEFMVHMAEDIVPDATGMQRLVYELASGREYAGERWGEWQDEVSSQFFACRTGHLCGVFDPCAITGAGHLEAYLRDLLPDEKIAYTCGQYRTTHDFAQWQRWAMEVAS